MQRPNRCVWNNDLPSIISRHLHALPRATAAPPGNNVIVTLRSFYSEPGLINHNEAAVPVITLVISL